MRGIIVSAVSALALSVSVAGPAAAEQQTIHDPKGDVFRVAEDGTEGTEPLGSVPNTDVTRSVIRHSKHAVGLTVKYVKLKKNASAFISYDAEIRVPRQGVFHILVLVDPSMKSAAVNFTDAHYTTLDCVNATAKVHPDKGRMLARVPRSCLGNPKWIRFGASALSLSRVGAKKAFVDNALANGGQLTGKLYAG